MTRRAWATPLLVGLLGLYPGSARAQQCVYGRDVERSCGKQGCLVLGAVPARPGDPGTCGVCRTDGDCEGLQCTAGVCQVEKRPIAMVPDHWYPHYHLAVVDAAFDFHREDGFRVEPTFGSGYWFRGAFRNVVATPPKDGGPGAEVDDPPAWFFHLGISLAVVSSAQNVFGEAALFHYLPAAPLSITGYSLGVLYQREGASILKLDDELENSDRLGPAVGVELFHNLTLRVSYILPLRGPLDYQSVLVSLVYMKSLLSDLIPEQYQAVLPSYF